MLKLIQNEWMKLWAKKSSWIILILLLLIVLAPAIITKLDERNLTNQDWRVIEQDKIANFNEMRAEDLEAGFDVSWMDEEIQLSQYRLDHNIASSEKQTTLGFLEYSMSLTSMISLLTVIIAASIVSNEFSTGTIKMLLTRPASRAKVLTSKLLTVFAFGFLLIAINLVVSFITGTLLFDSGPDKIVYLKDGEIVEAGILGDMLKQFALSFGDFFLSILFAFMIGSVFRSSSLAIGLTMVISLMGSLVVVFLSRYEFVKYIWLTHVDLTQHHTGNTMVEGITLGFSIAVLAVYAVIFLAISYFTFMKRDITA